MPESHGRDDARAPKKAKKSYASPKLTEYGSVSKLTMAKGSSATEIVANKKKCL